MTYPQLARFTRELRCLEPAWVHHGMCKGGDHQANQAAHRFGMLTWGHPPLNTKFALLNMPVDRIDDPLDYRDRDLVIVRVTAVLLAGPPGPEARHPRSGTWLTIRLARKEGKPQIIVMPSGEVKREDW
jgi:hypothetical protein